MTTLNKIIKFFYYLNFSILLALALISIGSYFNVYSGYGEVPLSNDYTKEFVDSGKQFNIFPVSAGRVIIIAYFYSIIVSIIFLPLLFILNHFNNKIRVYKKFAIALIILHVLIWLQLEYSCKYIS